MSQPLTVEIPVQVRTALGHAAVQHLCRTHSVDILHIKGVAADPTLRAPRGPSSDIDILVRPRHLAQMISVLREHGWHRLTSFQSGSAFEHAAVWHHPVWGSMDLHRRWPGFTTDADAAFSTLWGDRRTLEIAAVQCDVPSRPGQALVLLLHAARGPATQHSVERRYAWEQLSETEQHEVQRLVRVMGAEVPFALILDRFHEVAHHHSADLWWTMSHHGSRLDEWRARLKASPTRRGAARTLVSGLFLSRDYLSLELGHEPTARDLVRANVERVRRGLRDAASSSRRRARGDA